MLLRNPCFLLLIVTFLRLWSACSSSSSCCAASIAWAKGPMALSYNTSSPRLPGWPLCLGVPLPPWNSKDKKCCLYKTPYVAAPIKETGDITAKNYALCTTTRNRFFFLIHEWHVSEENRLIISRLLCAFSTKMSTSKGGTRKDYLSPLRSSTTSNFKCLIKDSLLWCCIMSMTLRNPEN